MKRSLGSSDSLGALMSICPTTEENSPRNAHVYSREFQSMLDGLDEEGCVEESGGQIAEKKRRLSVEQVKALEKNFEVENKLEPERKVKLAQELGLQPRQVAVWFQNRRARWKTKQLERDYGVLKANFENLKHNYDTLQRDNETLLKEIRELKAKLNEQNSESNLSVKEEIIIRESDNKVIKESDTTVAATITASESKDLSYDAFNTTTNIGATGGISIFPADNFKDGSSDSDSSAILNEDNSPNAAISSSGIFQNHGGGHQIMSPAAASSSLRFNSSSSSPPPSSMNCFHFSDTKAVLSNTQKAYSQTQFVKLEEHNFFSGEEAAACTFFSDEQAPSLHWYCPDQWS